MVRVCRTSMQPETNAAIVRRNANCADRVGRALALPIASHTRRTGEPFEAGARRFNRIRAPSAFVLHLTPLRSQRTNQSRKNRLGPIPTDWFIRPNAWRVNEARLGRNARGSANARLLSGKTIERAMQLPKFVIASQRVRAKRGPMTGSAKQSRVFPRRDSGLLRCARNDGR